MKYIMAAESRRLYDWMSEDKLNEKQKEQMNPLMSDNMKDTELMTALWILSSILKEYYNITILQSTRSFRTNKEMVWRLPFRKHRYLLPMGCDQSLPSIKNRTRCNTTAILDQYKRKLYRKTIYRKSKPTNKKRNRAIDRRKSNPERNQIRTNIQRTRQHDRESLECTLRNRLPHPTGKTT